jgi:hypothetical protein
LYTGSPGRRILTPKECDSLSSSLLVRNSKCFTFLTEEEEEEEEATTTTTIHFIIKILCINEWREVAAGYR